MPVSGGRLPQCTPSGSYPRTVTTALDNPEKTTLGRNFAPLERAHPKKSGYLLLSHGVDALVARLKLMDAAQKTIDVQYYLYRFDIAGKMFTQKLLDAADRGVRVRLLLDDMEIDDNDFRFAVLGSHPNIQVRFFNPFAGRSDLGRFWSVLVSFKRVNQRMHNKIFAVDNEVAIVGGRNIADAYFSVDANPYFSDLDLLAVGPIVREVSASFDDFWNSELAVPVSALVTRTPTEKDLKKFDNGLKKIWIKYKTHVYSKRLQKSDFNKRIENKALDLIWAPGRVLYDKPDRILHNGRREDRLSFFGSALEPYFENTSKELLLISPYLIPGKSGMALFRDLRRRGVKIRILTNSLAATDVAAVYGAYTDYRKAILRMGIDLFELKPNAKTEGVEAAHGSSVGATLHAKTMVFDRTKVFVGSMNLDLRSVYDNTELGLMVTSPQLCERVVKLFGQMTSPESSLRLSLGEDGETIWPTLDNGREVRYDHAPYVSFWKILWSDLAGFLTPDSLL